MTWPGLDVCPHKVRRLDPRGTIKTRTDHSRPRPGAPPSSSQTRDNPPPENLSTMSGITLQARETSLATQRAMSIMNRTLTAAFVGMSTPPLGNSNCGIGIKARLNVNQDANKTKTTVRMTKVVGRPGESARLRREEEKEQRRWDSIFEAREYLFAFVNEGWESNMDHIKVVCSLTTDELRRIGKLERPEGVAQCRKLFVAPVLNDEIACALWKILREDVANGARKKEIVKQPTIIEEMEISPQISLPSSTQERPRPGPSPRKRSWSATERVVRAPSPPETGCTDCGSQARPMRTTDSRRSEGLNGQTTRQRSLGTSKIEDICVDCGLRTHIKESPAKESATAKTEENPINKRPKRASITRLERTLSLVGESLSYGYGQHGHTCRCNA
jgi:hypothetical protein